MRSTFRYTLKSLIRTPSILVWTMVFPIVLSTLFGAMFQNLDSEAYHLDPIPVAVVQDENYDNASAFQALLDAPIMRDSELFDVHLVDAPSSAQELLKSEDVIGYITLNSESDASLVISPVGEPNSMEGVERTLLADIVQAYAHNKAALEYVIKSNPERLSDSSFLKGIFNQEAFTEEISITHGKSAQSMRYYYALLGFAAMLAANAGLTVTLTMQPNTSSLGARRSVSGKSRASTLLGGLLAAWILSFAALIIAFCYMRFIIGVDFGGREPACILGLGISSIMSVSLGALVASLPRIAPGPKSGILMGLTVFLGLFAGLYGSAAMGLSDLVAKKAPLLASINPAKVVSDMFYGLYVYTDLEPFAKSIGVLLILTCVFALLSAFFMRKVRHAHL